MLSYLISAMSNPYLALFLGAGLGFLLGKVKVKGFSLGASAGIFTGIVIGWGFKEIASLIPQDSAAYDSAQSFLNNGFGSYGVYVGNFEMIFLLLFICSIGLGVGKKIKSALNWKGVKLAIMGLFIPAISMGMIILCVVWFPGQDFYQLAGEFTGAMTNTAALGTSKTVVASMDADEVETRYEALSDEDKETFMELVWGHDYGEEETDAIPETLSDEQIETFKSRAQGMIATGYAISFPVGTIVIILAMSILGALTQKYKPKGADEVDVPKNLSYKQGLGMGGGKPLVFAALPYGFAMVGGILLGSITIPIGGNATFSLGPVGGVLIASLVFGNITHIGKLDLTVDPKALGFMREFALLLFMTTVGLENGYEVVQALAGHAAFIAISAGVIELIAILIAIVLGRFIFKFNWGILSGAISGGCTSGVGLGAAISTLGPEEPTIGYGISQPFAIVANVVLITVLHNIFII